MFHLKTACGSNLSNQSFFAPLCIKEKVQSVHFSSSWINKFRKCTLNKIWAPCVWIYSTLQLLAEANNMLCGWIFELLSPRWCLVMRTPMMLCWKTSDLPLWLAWCDSTPSPTGLWAFVFGWSSMAAFGTVSVYERGFDGQRPRFYEHSFCLC